MKNLLVLTLVLAMASVASAGLLISVDGIVDPPDSSINLQPSQEVVLDIFATGGQLANAGAILGVVSGPGTVTTAGGLAVNNVNPDMFFDLDSEMAGMFGMTSAVFFDLIVLAVPIPVIDGLVADGIIFHCDGTEDVTLVLTDLDDPSIIYDTQVIHQPEPMTMALLGLGGLFLRRRK